MSEAARPGVAPTDVRDPRPARTAVDLPDRRLFWRWVWEAVRPVVGWVLAALGALALFLGWYGVSGEALTAKQLPYLVSGGLTGIGLIVLAGVFLATDDVRRQLGRLDEFERKLDDLYALFAADIGAAVEPAPAAVEPAAGSAPSRVLSPHTSVVALPSGTSYHRPDCALVAGKPGAAEVDPATVETRGLRPCRVCDPPPVTG
jgi:hypothetical protein